MGCLSLGVHPRKKLQLFGFVHLLLINMTHLSGCLGSCRMHNTELLRLAFFLGNQMVGGGSLFFAQLLWVVHLPMLVVPWVWWSQRLLRSRGCYRLFLYAVYSIGACRIGVIYFDWVLCLCAVCLWRWGIWRMLWAFWYLMLVFLQFLSYVV